MADMGSCSSVRRQKTFSWLTAVWFSSALRAAVGGVVELQAVAAVAVRCGSNATLKCEATAPPQIDIKQFFWVSSNKTCRYNETSPELWCESASEPPRRTLALTLVNVMPVDQGKYMCKLRANLGVADTQTVVTVQDCLRSVTSSINTTHASCCFSGVYPAGVVHWAREDLNLTDLSSLQEQRDLEGRYNICSTMGVNEGNTSEPFRCSLWIPSRQTYLASKNISLEGGQEPSRRVATLQGVLVVLEMVVLKLVA